MGIIRTDWFTSDHKEILYNSVSVNGQTGNQVIYTGSGLFNPLPEDKILGLLNLKAFADDKLESYSKCFQKAFSSSASKVVIVW